MKNILGRVIAASLITGIALAGSQLAAGAGELPAGADRIAVLQNGQLSAKEGTLFASWVAEIGNVQKFEVAGNLIGALTTDGTLYVKEGSLEAAWTSQASGVKDFRLSSNRIAVLRTDASLAVKEGLTGAFV